VGLSGGRRARETSFGALLALAGALDHVGRSVGKTVRWLAVLLVLIQLAVVVLRYAFGTSYIWLQESVLYTNATLFMLAIGYTYLVDQHVRVDVLYAGWSPRRRALVDLLAVIVAVLPFCALVVWASWDYAARSWAQDEGPMAYGGIPLVPALKSLIPLMAILLGLQAVSIAIRCVAVLTGAAETHFPHRAHQGAA
jgi:TRAP-type mannitol/chloroaromatic compound transport system permease small subunit